ncbi:MAG: hypothetical protein ACOY90_16840 [Candidatus Zhuqueibacterota bacterium]
MRFIFKVMLLILLSVRFGAAQEMSFLTFSTTKARPLAMGSAYTAVEDDIFSASYNPATLSFYRYEKEHRLTLYVNPMAPAAALQRDYRIWQGDGTARVSAFDMLKSMVLLVKSIAFTGKYLDLALVFHEQILDEQALALQKKMFEDCDIWKNSYHSFLTRIKLAERVSLGFSGSLYVNEIDNHAQQGMGFSYGILLKPSTRMNVGLAYVDFPKNAPDIRMPLERLSDETMNIGVTYRPTSSTLLAFDFRNLTEDSRKTVREAHFGFEQNIFSIIALRGGYYKERFSNNHVFSGGVGIVDSNLFFNKQNRFNHAQFLLNYSFVFQKKENDDMNWHVLSLYIRL